LTTIYRLFIVYAKLSSEIDNRSDLKIYGGGTRLRVPENIPFEPDLVNASVGNTAEIPFLPYFRPEGFFCECQAEGSSYPQVFRVNPLKKKESGT
jgi:hypothetical protein